MDRQVEISVEQFLSQMRGEFEEAMRQCGPQWAVDHADSPTPQQKPAPSNKPAKPKEEKPAKEKK